MEKARRRLFSIIFVCFLTLMLFREGLSNSAEKPKKSLSAFPILMYDTDIGLGYGGKAKFVHYLAKKESFDFIVFNSSKGERWYVFAFSIPDFEIRQGKKYPISFDIKAEYDKYLKYSFYGAGVHSKKEDELFSPFISLVFRYDTSDSQIHPRRGFRLLLQNDTASKLFGNKKARYSRFTLDLRKYLCLFGQRDVLAFRGLVQKISGASIPLLEMSFLGGGSAMNAMRGYKLNRFMDKGKFLLNGEYRFPLWKKAGGNIFIDGGCVWSSWSKINLNKFLMDYGWGLRYYLQNFVVRFDMGISSESTGIYFNFGHIF